MARDDPASAARLLLALAPALRAVVEPPLDFDLTIRGTGTYAVTLGADDGDPAPRSGRRGLAVRPRIHVSAEVAALAELVAGADTRLARWHGPGPGARASARGATPSRPRSRRRTSSLAAAVRAGAALPPDLVFRAFAYVDRARVDPRPPRSPSPSRSPAPTPAALHVVVARRRAA